MLFNSLTFVVFFVVVVTAYWSIHSWIARKNLLVTASYVFYGAWNPPFAALLFSTTAMDFWLGRQIAKPKNQSSRHAWLIASVCMNLSMLGFFKYGNFLLENFQWLLARIGVIYHPPHLDILLPLGLFEKIVLADTMLAGSADRVFGYAAPLVALDSWLGVIAFAGQIFFDFAGYSTCAIGAALCLGFHLKDNFRFPYAAIGFSDFWRRWHISLSTFLRDYLYIPLGGNRMGWTRAAINLVIVMFLGGLWHGAAWTFVVWGLLHGSYLVIEHASRALIGERAWSDNFAVNLLLGLVTYGAVCLAWVFFRASDFTIATRMLRGMFGGHPHGDAILATREMLQIGIVTFFMMLAHWSLRETNVETAVTRLPRWLVTTAWALMACAIILTQGTSNAFIYFQF